MQILAGSKQHMVFNEFETVTLKNKKTEESIQIGDFYGEPQVALITI